MSSGMNGTKSRGVLASVAEMQASDLRAGTSVWIHGGNRYDIFSTQASGDLPLSNGLWARKRTGTAASRDIGTAEDEVIGTNEVKEYFGLQFQPSVQPSISSNFSRNKHELMEDYGLEPKTLKQLWDVYRNSTATRVDHRGLIVPVAVNEPRIDWSSGEPALLVEEQRTNFLPNANTLVGGWAAIRLSVNDSGIPSPLSGFNWVRLTEIAEVTAEFYVDRLHTVTAGEVYTFSCYVAENTELDFSLRLATQFSGERCVFNTTTGLFSLNDVGATVDKCVGGWRISMTATATATATAVLRLQMISKGRTAPSYEGTGLSCLVIAPQLEQAPTPSSYIPTEASAVTRLADNVSRELGAEFNASEGTLFAKFKLKSLSGRNTFIGNAESGTGNAFNLCQITDTLRSQIYDANTAIMYGAETNKVYNFAVSFKSDGSRITALNGEVTISTGTASDFSFAASLRSRARVSSFTGDGFVLYESAYFPKSLSEAELIELTRSN